VTVNISVLHYPNKALRALCGPVKTVTPGIEKLVLSMIETMIAQRGAGLAAPQIGSRLRIFVVDIGGVRVFINPQITSRRSGLG